MTTRKLVLLGVIAVAIAVAGCVDAEDLNGIDAENGDSGDTDAGTSGSDVFFAVEIVDYHDPVDPYGSPDTQEVTVRVENTGGQVERETQTIRFEIDGVEQDSERVTLGDGGTFRPQPQDTIEFTWTPEEDDDGLRSITVSSEDDSDTERFQVLAGEPDGVI